MTPGTIVYGAASGDDFGYSASVSGTNAVVGAIHAANGATLNTGAAYFYSFDGTTLTPGNVVYGASSGAGLGQAVSISGSAALVSDVLVNGNVHIYDKDVMTGWVMVDTLSGSSTNLGIGYSVALGDDGSILATSASLTNINVTMAKYDTSAHSLSIAQLNGRVQVAGTMTVNGAWTGYEDGSMDLTDTASPLLETSSIINGGTVTISGSFGFSTVNGQGQLTLSNTGLSTLVINTANYSIGSDIIINKGGTSSTVIYNFAGNQAIIDVTDGSGNSNYGQLTIQGGGTKTAAHNLTVLDTLSIGSDVKTYLVAQAITVGKVFTAANGSDITMSGDWNFGGTAANFSALTAAFHFNGTALQNLNNGPVTFAVASMELNNDFGLNINVANTLAVNTGSFTFNDSHLSGVVFINAGDFQVNSSVNYGTVSLGHFFVTAGAGSLVRPLTSSSDISNPANARFVMGVSDGAGKYKWTDIVLNSTTGGTQNVKVRLINGVVTDASGNPTDTNGSVTVTWDIVNTVPASAFQFTLNSWSTTLTGGNVASAVGIYFEKEFAMLHYLTNPVAGNNWVSNPFGNWSAGASGYYYVGHSVGMVKNNNDSGADSLRAAIDAVNLSGSGLVVFDQDINDPTNQFNAAHGANVQLTSGLTIDPNIHIMIIGLTNHAYYYNLTTITAVTPFSAPLLQIGTSLGAAGTVTMQDLIFNGRMLNFGVTQNNDSVLLNYENTRLIDITVLGGGSHPTIDNFGGGTITVGTIDPGTGHGIGFLALDASAAGTSFIYVSGTNNTGSTLQYLGNVAISVGANSAEFSTGATGVFNLVVGATTGDTGTIVDLNSRPAHYAVRNALTVNAGATLNVHDVVGVTGLTTVNAGGALALSTVTNTAVLHADGGIVNAGLITVNDASVIVDGGGFNAAGDAGILTYTGNGSLYLKGLNNYLGTFNVGNSNVYYQYNTAALNINTTTYYNLTIGGADYDTGVNVTGVAAHLITDAHVMNALTISLNNSLELNTGNHTLDVHGDLDVAGTLILNDGTLALYGALNNLGTITFNPDTSTVEYLGGDNQQIDQTVNYYNLVIGGGAAGSLVTKGVTAATFTVNNDLTVNAYTTFTVGGGSVLTVKDNATVNGTLTTDSSILNVTGTSNINGTANFNNSSTANLNILNVNTGGNLTVDNSALNVLNGSATTIQAGGTATIQNGGSTTLSGLLNVAGTLTTASSLLEVDGAMTISSGGTANFTAGANENLMSTLNVNAGGTLTTNTSGLTVSGATTIAGTASFNAVSIVNLEDVLTVNAGGILNTSASTLTVALATTINGTASFNTGSTVNLKDVLNVNAGGSLTDDASSLTVTGLTTINAGGALTLNNAAVVHASNSGIVNAGSITVNNTGVIVDSGDFNGSGNTGTLTFTGNGSLYLKGLNNYLGTFNAGNSNVYYQYNGTGTLNINSDSSGNITYYSLTIGGADYDTALNVTGVTAHLNANALLNGNLTITAGNELQVNYTNANTLRVNGDVSVTGTLTFLAGGDLDLYGANNNLGSALNFKYGQSTVQYLRTSDQQISASQYYNLVIGGGAVGAPVTKGIVADVLVHNNFTVNSNTSFNIGTGIGGTGVAATLEVVGTYTNDGAVDITNAGGYLRLDSNVILGAGSQMSFTDGTVVYQGDSAQVIVNGTYYNLAIENGDKILPNGTGSTPSTLYTVTVTNNFLFSSQGGSGYLLIGSYSALDIGGLILNQSSVTGSQRFFVNTTINNSGAVYVRPVSGAQLMLGSADPDTAGIYRWAEMTVTGASTDYVGFWNFGYVTTDGSTNINKRVNPVLQDSIVDITIMAVPTAAMNFSLTLNDSYRGVIDPDLASTWHYTTQWNQVTNPLSQSGAYYFGTIPLDAGMLVVTNADASGLGSLRDAVMIANILGGTNEITFSESFFSTARTITLNGPLVIKDSVIIKGLGTDLITVDGSGSSNQIFVVDDNTQSSISVYISGMTLTHGNGTEGGAILNREILRLENVEIKNSGILGTTLGGGIFNDLTGTLYTLNVTVAENAGEGIYNLGRMSLFNTTVGNNAGSVNGQIYTASGAGSELFNVTVFAPGAGLAITNADNANPLALKATLVYGTLNNNSYFTQTNSLVTDVSTIFVNGGELQDNGGWVRTFAINNDARVVDMGLDYADGAYNNDARGYLVYGTHHDIGAFEYNGYVARNTATGLYYSSVQAAVDAATGGNTIDLVDTRITTGATSLVIAKNIIIEGSGGWSTVLAADSSLNSSVIVVGLNNAPAVALYNFGIRDGHANGSTPNGGAILNNGNLQLREMVIANNAATGNGGAIYISNGAFMSLDRSTVSGNSAAGDGGAIYNLGTAYSVDSTIANNTAVNGGGAYNGLSGIFRLNRSTMNDNAAVNGGAVYSLGSFYGENSTIADNTASGNGGGIYVGNGAAASLNMTIAYNTASVNGGGVYVASGSSFSAINTIVAYNTNGGGAYSDLYAADGAVINISTHNDLIGNYTYFKNHTPVSGNFNFNYGIDAALFAGSLTDNGGWTETLALTSSNKAIGGGDSNISISNDQRGYLTNGTRDIGAYEYNGYVGWFSYTSGNSPVQTYVTSIQQGLNDIKAQALKYNNLTLNLINTRILESGISINLDIITSDDKTYIPVLITIAGSVQGETVISGGHLGRIFSISSNDIAGGTLTLNRLTVADGSALVKLNPNIIPKPSDGFGGAAYVYGANLKLNNVSVINSYSDRDGGAIYSIDNPAGIDGKTDVVGNVNIQNSFLGWNFSANSGGALALAGTSTTVVNDSTLYGNISGGSGGAIAYFGKGAFAMTSDTVAYNLAMTPSGGGIYLASQDGSGTLTAGNNLLAHNYQTLNPDRYADVVTNVSVGSGAPGVKTGNNGDAYINETADAAGKIGDMYIKSAGVWNLASNLVSAYHITYYSGSALPLDTIGQKGDIYVDTATGYFFVRLANGTGANVWGDLTHPDLAAFQTIGGITLGSSQNGVFPPATVSPNSFCLDTYTGLVYLGVQYLDPVTGAITAKWVIQENYSNRTTPQHISDGAVAPVNVPPGAVDGDYYVNTVNGQLYVLINNNWNMTQTISGSGGSSKAGMDYYLFTGKLTDSGYNLVESQNGIWNKDASPNFFGMYVAKTATAAEVWSHDWVVTGPAPADKLATKTQMGNLFLTGSAQDNGGWSYTVALNESSLAVNNGTARTADQRGYLDFQLADIGAYEAQGIVAQIGTNSYSSVQAAVDAANSSGNSSGNTITLIGSRIRENDIQSDTSLTINGIDGSVLDADHVGRIIMAKSSAITTNINGLILTGGMALDSSLNTIPNAAGNGGALFNNGSLTLTDVQVFDSFAQRSGGGVYSSNSLTIKTGSLNAIDYATIFADNSAGVSGGAVAALGSLTVKGVRMNGDSYSRVFFMVEFVNNEAWSNGGAVALQGNGNMQYFYMADNHSSLGGALMLSGANANSTLQDFLIEMNVGDSSGGAIYAANYGNLTIIGNDNPDYIYTADHNLASINNNYSGNAGGGIYFVNSGNLSINGIEGNIFTGVAVDSNKAMTDGGGIFFANSNNLQLGNYIQVDQNTADGSGGGIYFLNGNQLALMFNCNVDYNWAGINGGGIYMQNSQMLSTNADSFIEYNHAGYNFDSGVMVNALGGGLYLNNIQTVSLNYTTISDNAAYLTALGQNHGAGIYMYNCASINLTDVEVHNSYYAEGVYIDSSSSVSPIVSIMTSSINTSYGTGIYMTKGTLSMVDVTVGENGYYISTDSQGHKQINLWADVGGIYLAQGTLNINFCTLVNNTGNSVATLKLGDVAAVTLTLKNTIVDGYSATNVPKDITNPSAVPNVPDVSFGTVTVNSSSYNILANYYNYNAAAKASALAGSSYKDIYNYNTLGVIDVAGAIDGSHNIGGYDSAHAADISNHLSLESLQYQANYRTRTYALASKYSVAYGYYTNANGTGFTGSGQIDSSVGYDQRGNLRTGITVSLDTNGQTLYTYYQYSVNTWQKVVVNEAGISTITNVTASAVSADSTVSIGAFEPLFYVTVTSKADDSGRMFNIVSSNPNSSNTRFDAALVSGLNLREATYWIDSYNPETVAANLVDVNRYVKFSGTVFTAGGDNTIHLLYDDIILKKDILISLTPDAWNNYTVDTVAYLAQDNPSRITIDGGNSSRIFRISEDLNSVTAVISNLTLTNGRVNGVIPQFGAGTGGRGGAIYNDGTLTLNNMLIENSQANSSGITGANYRGLGGAIYNNTDAVLTINDSTLLNNLAIDSSHDTSANHDGLGGALYNAGTVTINRSLIYKNTAQGFAYDTSITNGDALGLGGGIYSSGGSVTLSNNTITGNTLNGSTSAAGSAIYLAGGDLSAYNNTIVGNPVLADVAPGDKIPSYLTNRASAVYLSGDGSGNVILVNNIIALNQVPGGFQQYHDVYTATTIVNKTETNIISVNITESNNIVGNFRGAYVFSAANNDIIGDTRGNVNNLNLSNTLDYLGGKTMSFRVEAGSVAISHGLAGVTTGDQRIATNDYWNARTTIGAYELITKVTVTTTADPIAVVNDVSYDFTKNQNGWLTSLRTAAFLADAGTVTINPAVGAGNTINLVYGGIRIGTGITITTAAGLAPITIDGSNCDRVFMIDSFSTALVNVTLQNLTLQNGYAGTLKNDYYIDVSTGNLYLRSQTGWIEVGSSGVTGSLVRGVGKPTVAPVASGNNYVDVSTGTVYSYDTTAKKWSPVITFAQMETTFNSKVYAASGAPVVGADKSGDYYVNTANGTLYQRDFQGNWSLIETLITVNTQKVYSGTTVPTSATAGNNGDVYVVVTDPNATKTMLNINGNVYQKVAGQWVFSENIIGSVINQHITNGVGAPTALGTGQGGAIFSNENLRLSDVTVQNNMAAADGGGVYVTGATLTMDGGTAISGNTALLGNGGGIFINAGTLNATGVSISGQYNFVEIANNTAVIGGGVYGNNSVINLGHKMVWDGTGTPPAIIVGADIHNNFATFGGGVGLVGSQLNMYFSTIDSNQATAGSGGGLYLNNAAVNDIENSTISNNTASRFGGGIYASVQELDLVNSTISNNVANSLGGGIYFAGTDALSLTYTTIANNQSGASGTNNGAGVYQLSGKLNMVDSIIAQNYSSNTVSEVTRDDYYAEVRVAAGSISYSIIGANNVPQFFAGTGMIKLVTPSDYSALGLNTTVESNGGPTSTVWVKNNSLAIGHGQYINPSTLLPYAITDQRGVVRSPAGPTIGAYEKNIQHLYFTDAVGNNDVNNVLNWNWGSNLTHDFNIADAIYTISYISPTLYGEVLPGFANNWTVGVKSSVEVNGFGKLIVNSGATFTAQDVVVKDNAYMKIAGIMETAALQNAALTVLGNSTLEIATADSSISTVSITLQAGDTTTIIYSYNGNQTVRNLGYYNLELAGGGTKTSAATLLSVGNNLSIDSSTLKLGGDLTVANTATLNSGIITAGVNDININGNLASTGSTITGGDITFNGNLNTIGTSTVSGTNIFLSGFSNQISGSTLTASGNLDLTNNAGIELDASTVNAGVFSVAAGSTVSTGTSGGLSTINSASVMIDFTAGMNVVTVNDGSKLVFNTQNQNVLLDNVAGNTANHFMVSDLTVRPAGVIEFKTSGTVTAQNIALGDDAGIQGTMWLSGAKQVIFDNTIFDNAYLVANGPVTLNADTLTSHSFQIRHDIAFLQPVTLAGASGSTVTVISTQGTVEFDSTVTSTSGGQNFIIDAHNNAIVNNIAKINNLDIYAATGSIQPTGTITATGIVTMHNQVTVNAGTNASITAQVMDFQSDINGNGRLNLSSQSQVEFNSVNMGLGSYLNLVAGNYDTNGNVMTAGSLTVGKLASLVYDTMNLYGNLSVTGALSSGSLNLLDGSGVRQILSLTGTQSFIDVDLRNTAGAQLSSGNMTVLGNFAFTAGGTGSNFALNSNTLQVWGNVVNANQDHYFVTNGVGFLRLQVNQGATTEFWVGGQYASDVSVTGISNSAWFSVSCMVKVTGTGTPSSPTIFGNDSTVKNTWIIKSDTPATYQLALAWNSSGDGSVFAPLDKANVFNYQGWHWVSVQNAVDINKPGIVHNIGQFTTSNTGSFTIAAPNTDFSFSGEFRGLNNSSENQNFGPLPSIAVDVPPSQGEESFNMLQLVLSESPLGNPLDIFIPPTGTDLGGENANDFLTINTGESVYGSPNGEAGVNTEWMPREEREVNPISDEIDRQLEDFFTELAGSSVHEKHPAFRSEIDILLEKLMAS